MSLFCPTHSKNETLGNCHDLGITKQGIFFYESKIQALLIDAPPNMIRVNTHFDIYNPQ